MRLVAASMALARMRSTLTRLALLCDTGGAVAAQAALAQMALAAGLYAGPVPGAKTLPEVGGWTPQDGLTCPAAFAATAERPRVLVIFYRTWLTAHDLDPVQALVAALRAKGFDVLALFAPTLSVLAPRSRSSEPVSPPRL